MENPSSAQLPEKLNAEEHDLVILGGGTGSTTLAMAQSPAVLNGYMGLSVALIKGRLGKRLGEELALTLAGTNRCEYCASANSTTPKSPDSTRSLGPRRRTRRICGPGRLGHME
jgi:hypothetical protein